MHGGYMWLDRPISIDTDLITRITGLPTQGEDPTLMFADKKIDRALSEAMKQKFHTVRGVHGLDVPSICDPTIIFVTQALACKLLQKCRKDQVPAGVIVATEKVCGRDFNELGAPFLLNQFLIDLHDTQDRGMEFHYPWLLIFLAFTTWETIQKLYK
jgi:hypothetical protein